jgi:diadenylate cyclase
MDGRADNMLLRSLSQVAPGSPLRDGLDRVLQSGRGGLIVIGDGPDVLNICSGGFLLDAAFTPQRLGELAKMDGAIILAGDASRIARANVHLVETGTRHRTAERVARSLHVPVVAVSESRKEIQVYVGDQRHPLEPVGRLLDRSNQALQTLERYRTRLNTVTKTLTALEVENLVTLRDVIEVLQRIEMVVRISDEINRNLIELGSDGRLVRLQLDELMAGVVDDRRLIIRDYFNEDATFHIEEAMDGLSALDDEALFDEEVLTKTLHLAASVTDLDETLEPRGFRFLNRLPRVSEQASQRMVDRFGSLERLLRATSVDLQEASGLSSFQAENIKEGLARLAENSILDRYEA